MKSWPLLALLSRATCDHHQPLQYNATPEEQCFPSPARTYFTQMESARYILSIPFITFLVHRHRITFIFRFLYSFQNKREKNS